MNLDPQDFSALRRKATELMADTADVPALLRSRLGEQHELARAADEMVAKIEGLVYELRSFDASSVPVAADTYQDP